MNLERPILERRIHLAPPILVVACLTLVPFPGDAAVFTVDTLADGVDANPADNLCLTASGDCTLRAAVQQATTAPGPLPHTIFLSAWGTYLLDTCCDQEDAGAEGDLDLNTDLEIVGVSPANTIIQQTVTDRVFHCESSPDFLSVTLRNLTVTGGIFLNTSASQDGAGLLFSGCHHVLDNVVVDGNLNSSGGVGCNVAVIDSDSLVRRSTITGGDGACTGAALHLINTASRTALMEESTVTDNAGLGAAVWVEGPQTQLTINNSTLSDNSNFTDGPNLHLEFFGAAALNHVTLWQDNLGQPNVRLDDASSTTLTLRNSLLQQDAGAANCDLAGGAGSIVSLGYNIESSNSCLLTEPTDSVDTDAFLALPADNGGPTRTHGFVGRSLAIDYIPVTGTAPNLTCNGFDELTDQRHAPRVGDCDAGAYEDMGCPDLLLSAETIFSSVSYEECSITAGPSLSVVGELFLTVGSNAVLRDGLVVEDGGALWVTIDPALQFVLPELVAGERHRRAVAEPQ